MKKAWFVRTHRFFKPVSLQGWLLTFAAVGYFGISMVRILRKSVDLNQTLADIALQLILTAVVYVLFAYLTQKR